ncbi:MAG: nuclear transport factor 2 family protein [Pseudomonadota bacterium]
MQCHLERSSKWLSAWLHTERPLFFISALLAAVLTTALAPSARADDVADRLAALEARAALISIADGLDAAVDAKDWETARGYFADEVRIDFSSLDGGPPSTISSDELIGFWRANLFAEKTSFHLRGNHVIDIDGDVAEMTSHGYAWNKLPGLEGGDFWEVWGVYEYAFARRGDEWKLTAFTFKATHQRGNAAVPGAPKPTE